MLGQIRDARAVDPLIAVLKDSNSELREAAIDALGQIREPALSNRSSPRSGTRLLSCVKEQKLRWTKWDGNRAKIRLAPPIG